ncbi:MAG: hypothetical protein QG602_980, partial [Verrucomicrobiota bacterium]|nr:hypothetical protein [Verrucomicrobiota bacterium]
MRRHPCPVEPSVRPSNPRTLLAAGFRLRLRGAVLILIAALGIPAPAQSSPSTGSSESIQDI